MKNPFKGIFSRKQEEPVVPNEPHIDVQPVLIRKQMVIFDEMGVRQALIEADNIPDELRAKLNHVIDMVDEFRKAELSPVILFDANEHSFYVTSKERMQGLFIQ